MPPTPNFTPSLNPLSPPFQPRHQLPPPSNPRTSKRLRIPAPTLPQELGKLIDRDVTLLRDMGWKDFVRQRRQRGDFASLSFKHPATRLLKHYKHHGAPVKFHSAPWSKPLLSAAIRRGPHRSCFEHIDFLEEEFVDMINKEQWVVLPYSAAKDLPGLRLSPPGVVPQRGRRPRWICDYTWSGVNQDTTPLAPKDAMQFGHALDRFLRELLLADPALGPLYLLKLDISDGFYRVNLAVDDIPKLGVVFPTRPGKEPLVALPLVLPMGWKNSPPIFSAATETSADLANQALQNESPSLPHPLNHHAAIFDDPPARPSTSPHATPSITPNATPSITPNATPSINLNATPSINLKATPSIPPNATPSITPDATPSSLPHANPSTPYATPSIKPYATPSSVPITTPNRVPIATPSNPPFATPSTSQTTTNSPPNKTSHLPPRPHPIYIPCPKTRDPSLPTRSSAVGYVDVFVDDFIAICQGHKNKSRIRNTLLHAVDAVFRPTDYYDNLTRREPVSIKKLRQGDCSWNTIKTVLGWIINTSSMTIELPPHRQERLGEILASIPSNQKRISIKKWHKILGELRSMAIALPGARNMFSAMQNALTKAPKHRVALKKGVHQALADFQWMYEDIAARPTRIAELVPLLPSALGYHDASGLGAGGVWYPTPDLDARFYPSQPLVWRLQWPADITRNIVSTKNPHGTITNSDLELAGGLLHLEILAQHFDIRERTVVSKTDNLATLFWQRKGNATKSKVPAHLLRLFGIHQRHHRYIPRHDYIPGLSNPMADDASRLFYLSDSQFLSFFNTNHNLQNNSYKLATLPLPMSSAVISVLRMKKCNAGSLLVEPPPPIPTGKNGSSTQLTWASIPFSKPSKIKYPCFRSSSDAFAPDDVLPINVKSSLGQLKTTYGLLPRRSLQWGPQTQGLTEVTT